MQQIDYLTEPLGFQGFYLKEMEVKRKEDLKAYREWFGKERVKK